MLSKDGKHLVLQDFAPVQNQYNDRHWDAAALVCLCFCAGGVQWAEKSRPYYAYYAYYNMHNMHITHILMGFVSHLSLGGLISIPNHLWAQGTSTSVVCHSSQLHTGMSSCCSSGWERDDTLWHAKRIIRLSWSFLWQKSEQWRWMLVVVYEQLGPWIGDQAIMGVNNERHWNETQNMQNM